MRLLVMLRRSVPLTVLLAAASVVGALLAAEPDVSYRSHRPMRRLPGLNSSSIDDDLQADGNLHWSVAAGPAHRGDFFAAWRASPKLNITKKRSPNGWFAHDLFANPRLVQLSGDWRVPADVRLLSDSRAIDAGVPIPADWPDPLRAADKGRPDIGALPLGAKMFEFGPTARAARDR